MIKGRISIEDLDKPLRTYLVLIGVLAVVALVLVIIMAFSLKNLGV